MRNETTSFSLLLILNASVLALIRSPIPSSQDGADLANSQRLQLKHKVMLPQTSLISKLFQGQENTENYEKIVCLQLMVAPSRLIFFEILS